MVSFARPSGASHILAQVGTEGGVTGASWAHGRLVYTDPCSALPQGVALREGVDQDVVAMIEDWPVRRSQLFPRGGPRANLRLDGADLGAEQVLEGGDHRLLLLAEFADLGLPQLHPELEPVP